MTEWSGMRSHVPGPEARHIQSQAPAAQYVQAMARNSKFVCTSCGYETITSFGRCPECQEWNSFEEVPVVSANGKGSGSAKAIAKGGGTALLAPAAVTALGDHKALEHPRFPSGNGELDRVLGGGFVPASAVVLGAPPGSGKSTLSSSVIDHLAGQGKRVAYVAGEESGHQIRMRTDRMGLTNVSSVDLITELEVGGVCARLASGYDFAVIDSIQTLYDAELSGAAGSVSIVKQVGQALVRTAKESGVTLLIVGQVNKDGNLAGPRHLEHMVDVVLSMEAGEDALRMLRASKNRFGSTDEIGVLEMTAKGLREVTDPTVLFLQDHDETLPGAAICPVVEGARLMMVEVQALADPAPHERPAMRRAVGVDKNKLDMLIAVLSRRVRTIHGRPLKLHSKDLYVQLSKGLRVQEPALDLALCVAIASAATDCSVKSSTAAFGEVSLLGEVRPVGAPDRRVNEATRLGWKNVIGPAKQGSTEALSSRQLKRAIEAALEPTAATDDPETDD